MLTRILSALVFVPIVLGLSYLGGFYMALLVVIISLLALNEGLRIGEKMLIKPWKFSTMGFAVLWFYLMFYNPKYSFPLIISWLLFSMAKMAVDYPKTSTKEVLFNFFIPIYTVVLLSHLYLIRSAEEGLLWTIFTFALVWATDTFAYLIGRACGRNPLAPGISPNKTIEGSIGGLVFCIISGLVLGKYISEASWVFFLVISFIIGVCAQLGDLFESALKRNANIKDSGNLIPGHGGILDRFDSMIFVIPIVYYGMVFTGIAG